MPNDNSFRGWIMTDQDQTSPKLIVPAMASFYEAVKELPYPFIRFFTGIMLMPHGAQKLFGWFGGSIESTAGFFAKIGLLPALPLAYLVGTVEFFGGLLLAIGFLTRPIAAAVVILMAVAVFQVHLKSGFFWFKGGYEYPLYWGLVCIALFFGGGGKYSVDRSIGKEF
jgi:putative oxidoreductase